MQALHDLAHTSPPNTLSPCSVPLHALFWLHVCNCCYFYWEKHSLLPFLSHCLLWIGKNTISRETEAHTRASCPIRFPQVHMCASSTSHHAALKWWWLSLPQHCELPRGMGHALASQLTAQSVWHTADAIELLVGLMNEVKQIYSKNKSS